MRVTYVNRGLGIYRGGGEMYDLRLARALAALGVSVDFLAGAKLLGDPLPVEGLPTRYVRTVYMRGWSYRVPWILGGRLMRWDLSRFESAAFHRLALDAPDIIQLLGLPRLAVKAVRRLGRPVVLNFPGPPDPKDKDAIRAASAVIANGDAYRVIAKDFREDVHDIPPGVDAELFKPVRTGEREKAGISASAPLVVYVGRLVPLKNLPYLLESFGLLRKEVPGARLAIVGDGALRHGLEALAARVAPGAVHFAGHVEERDLPAWYAAADLIALSSSYENYPNVLLEAMACERTVVATRVGGVPDLVGSRGRLAAPDEPAAFARELNLGLRDPGREKVGRENREWVVKNFSWQASAKKLLSVYEGLLR